MSLALYVHVPFCQQKCPYCDFNSFAGMDALHRPYARALMAEMARLAAQREWQVETIFVGGGTPTVLPLAALAQVLEAARTTFSAPAGAEVTVEANPGTVDEAYLAGLRAAGANRLSLGAQSFHDDELRLLGRIHSAAEVDVAFRAARRAGFENLNLDLLFGLPGQPLARWRSSLERALALGPEHLSLYSLTVEAGTPFADWIAAGDLPAPDDDLAADMYELAQEILSRAGYAHYEISNWARRNSLGLPLACRHNLVYWRNRPYLGVGAGAHAGWGGRRWRNLSRPHHYVAVAALEGGELPWQRPVVAGVEAIDESLAMGETMMLGLRLLEEGVSLAGFEKRFGRSLRDVYGDEIAALEEGGLLECLPDRVRLTRRGRLLGNQAFARFLPGDAD